MFKTLNRVLSLELISNSTIYWDLNSQTFKPYSDERSLYIFKDYKVTSLQTVIKHYSET